MEQGYDCQSLGIPAFRLGPLVLIAELAGEAEIVLGARSASNDGDHMVDLKPTQHIVLVAETVLAAMAGTSSYSSARIF